MKQLSDNQIEDIKKLYEGGMTPKEIGEKYNIYNNSVTRILKKNNVARTQCVRISKETCVQIINRYQSGESAEAISRDLNINGSTVCRALKRNNIELRTRSQSRRKFKINERYMQVIDCEEKAYFLGLLYSDGNVSKTCGDIKITLHIKDIDILNKLSKIIYGFEKISIEKRVVEENIREYATFLISSKTMKEDLANLGCLPAKTFTIDFPHDDIVPANLKIHFLRGYLDGDGCISTADPTRPYVGFSGNEKMISGIAVYIKNLIGLESDKIRNKKDTLNYMFELSTFDRCFKFLNILYNNSNIHLNRKYNKYLEFLTQYNDRLK